MIAGTIKLKPGKDSSVKRKHPWIFSGAIDNKTKNIRTGDWVKVIDSKNNPLGVGYYSDSSIAIKLIHFGFEENEDFCLEQNIKAAIEFRKILFSEQKNTNAYRLIFAESDSIPGLIADFYNNTVVIQAQTEAIHNKIDFISECIIKYIPDVECIYDKSASKLKLNTVDKIVYGNKISENITENGLKFYVDIPNGQKTGFFIDQRDNRRIVKDFSKDKNVLNLFAYTGGFSVYALAGGAKHVDSIDISENAVDITERNIKLNGFENNHNSICSDAFEYLQTCTKNYDLIIIDPPAFAKKSNVTNNALRAYKRINLMAMQKIQKNGLIFTFSCSQYITRELFTSAIRSAAIESGRNVKILGILSQPLDHPISTFVPETEYLKGLILSVK
ncbi:MAG: class I SAM-dependent rRNA methyltransferase [Bacteroidales bacterium]|jgi:23S rRNA (cytosine1962-C5)-methyltransferase|nr:class I SAM-dependent rRNA methyltransferase [Bacteroidales bacterium]HOL98221.1 class I SAM-dependent rRNA methyltransferase [Bacteroidales bacterium]HOM36444.1 class I SAM-dependent rRNA methyltransferase [Bacteroidales bacterium]HPD23882.1 class I SAM-dependent rRNA methyltransferase [Bacteroidales bacterium]HRS99953.1 class I SAM-dependent rRNA methyltransferase [Bacteroidales bacterium]